LFACFRVKCDDFIHFVLRNATKFPQASVRPRL
jgi:hypothetical protein